MQQVRLGPAASQHWPRPTVTIGNFDGVHRGHQALVAQVVADARREQGTAVVLSFDPHPARVVSPERAPAALTTPGQKRELLAALGCDVLAVLPFTSELAQMTPAGFVESVLIGRLGAIRVVVGAGFRFGRGQSGDVETLVGLGGRHGLSVEAAAPVLDGGRPVSSSRVRDRLATGDVSAASRLLGRCYSIDGRVVHGDGRGSSIQVPTANLKPENEILPERGVYACRCRLRDGSWRAAVVNVGERPTFGGGGLTVEAHLLDFSGQLYGDELRLVFEERLRAERRFSGADALVRQILEDVAQARALLSGRPHGGV